MADTYRPLPHPPALDLDQTVVQRGLAILAFVIETGVTATITDLDLERADHAGSFASGAPGMAPIAYDRVSHARRLIADAVRTRAKLYTATEARMAGGVAPHKPDLGPMAPLLDRPIVRPPSGDYADHDFARVDRVQF